jgi:hypothetical protein
LFDVEKFGLQHLVGLDQPIGHEDVLQFQHRRAGNSNHQLLVGDGRRIGRRHQVLRSGVADSPIDDSDLAVVAQVQPGHPPAQEADRE